MNRAQIRNLVRERYGLLAADAGLTDSVMNNLIDSGLRVLSLTYDWPWLETSNSVVTTAGTGAYSLPSDFLRSQTVVDQATGEMLTRVPMPSVWRRAVVQGRPDAYAIVGGSLVLAPTPDGVYTLNHRYYRQEPTLTSDASVPLVPDAYIDGLIHLVAAEAFRNARQMSRVEEAWAAWSRWLAVARDNINRSRAPLTVVVREGHPF
jgi:hypothetical protein